MWQDRVRGARRGASGSGNGWQSRSSDSSLSGVELLALAAAMSEQAKATAALAAATAELARETREMNLLLTSEALLGAEERRNEDPDPFRPMSNKR